MNAPHNNDDKKTPPMTLAEYQEQARQMSSNLKMDELYYICNRLNVSVNTITESEFTKH